MTKRITGLLLITLLSGSCLLAQEKAVRESTATENVMLLPDVFPVKGLDSIAHRVWIYLPPDYHIGSKRYPVIYMHDGQNLFDDKTSYVGEWGVDESLNQYFEKTGQGFIVVAIDNSGINRVHEYTPWKNERYGGGGGSHYVEFIVQDLKTWVDARYRTRRNAKNTALVGSSLGGLISYYGGLKFPGVFGRIGAFSTSFWFSDKVKTFTTDHGRQKRLRMALVTGELEGGEMVSGTRIMADLLLKTGFHPENLEMRIVPGGKHHETFWKSEFMGVVIWLFDLNE
jgi:predicted alpha/beta superfamily hydrolase